MTDTSALFPGFTARWLDGDEGRIFAHVGGEGPPLVLIHGFPQTHAMWHRLAPALAKAHTVVCPDLRGYGWSSAPESAQGERYSKREMGKDIVAIMEQLGHVTFATAGHDRGARVAYRLALDHPGRIVKLALLDILPTFFVWRRIKAGLAPAAHWGFLAGPRPAPETEIGKNPQAYFEGLMAKWCKSGTLDAFSPTAMRSYRAGFGDPSRISAMCEDYRAGAGLDLAADEADLAAGKTIDCSTHLVWGDFYLTGKDVDPLDVWRGSFAPQATGTKVGGGHFVAEEDPEGTLKTLQAFLAR
ncbi:MAG: alpha/beta hydrolase [Hyphomicrobiales bacterium]|nr:alpha/beta hydrolase [Hyphomicrobiales bacterium]